MKFDNDREILFWILGQLDASKVNGISSARVTEIMKKAAEYLESKKDNISIPYYEIPKYGPNAPKPDEGTDKWNWEDNFIKYNSDWPSMTPLKR